jgi:hypothetical protein
MNSRMPNVVEKFLLANVGDVHTSFCFSRFYNPVGLTKISTQELGTLFVATPM